MQEQQLTRLREAWLERAASFLVDYMVQCGLPRTAVRVSCGWPSRGGLAARVAVIGQCFPPTVCRDGIPQVFVSPRIEDSLQVLGVLLHELVHARLAVNLDTAKSFPRRRDVLGWLALRRRL